MRGRTIADLQRRHAVHLAAASAIKRRLDAIAIARCQALVQRTKVIDRVRQFLASCPELEFRPGEIREACIAGDRAVGEALIQLVSEGAIVRAGHAAYRIAR